MPTWTKEQSEAIEKSGTNIIVSAGAGSGKTAVLSERVIYKLNHGIHIDELLILTFTRAAAEEMKDRIRKKIKKDPALKRELDALNSSYITTFDSFALSVVKKYHYLLNIPKDISITDDTIVRLEKKRIIDEIFEEAYENMDEGFAHLVNRFTLKNDKPLKTAISSLIDKIDNFIDKRAYLDYLKEEFFKDEHIATLISEFKSLLEEKKNVLSLELENAYSYFDGDYMEKMNSVLLPIINASSIEELSSYKSAKLPSLKRGTDDEAKKAKDNVKSALDDIKALMDFGSEEKIKEDILSTKKTTLAIVDLIEKYEEKMEAYKKENGIYTFGDIACLAIEILTTHESARLELKNKFKEIMIDEYQDTNDVQETFISLISSDNVYMVGDIKQSIYRFRGSNPSIFKDKYDRFAKLDGGLKIDLIKNFRSREEVLDNINRIFDLIMDDDLGGAEYTVSHEMVFGNTAYNDERQERFDYNFEVLEYTPFETKEFTNSEIEIFAIARDIKEKMESKLQVFDKETSKLRPFKYSDAVIILDRSKYFDDFKKIFEFMHIPLTILKDDKLNSSSDIYIIKNIIDLIIRIKNKDFGVDFRYAFMSVGRSFLYEYTDEELFEILSTKEFKNSSLYKDFENIENYNSMTIKEFLLYILDVTDFYNKIYKIGDYANTDVRITKLVDMASDLASLGYTIEEFRDYLNDITESDLEIKYTAYSGNVDSVKILTIHKSKGLEYPICYFADLDHDFNTRELKEKFICSKNYGLIAPVSVDDSMDADSIIKLLYKSEFMKEEIGEKIRLFYVALTRAREKMIIVVPKKDTVKLEKNRTGTIEYIRRLKFKSLADFVYGVKAYLSPYFKEINVENIGITKDYLYNKKEQLKHANDVVDEFTVHELDLPIETLEEKRFSKNLRELVTKEDRKNMDFGTKVHEILEYLDFKNYEADVIEDEFLREKITKFINSELLEKVKEAKIYREYEFIYKTDDSTYHGSIDLMLEYIDHIDIVDYKLKNTTDVHYLNQLEGYKSYISSISNKPVNIYLYSILNEEITKLD